MPDFFLDTNDVIQGGRITLYEDPDPEKVYCLGLDFAYGLPDGDFDAGVMLDQYGDQVATVHGHWGPTAFTQVLWPLIEWFEPFVVGERQVGLPVLRELYDKGAWTYFHRADDSRGRTQRDMLGHHASGTDLRIPTLRKMIGPRDGNGILQEPKIKVRDAEVIRELSRFQYNPRSSTVSMEEARDNQLAWGAPHGEHDDLVSALSYAVLGQIWLPRFEKPKAKFAPDSIGAKLGHEKLMEELANPPQKRR